MKHLQFRRDEIDKLVLIKKTVESLEINIKKEKKLFPNTVHPEILANEIEVFLKRRKEYEKRFLKYKNQLFYLVTKEDFTADLIKWVNKICPDNEINEHHYLDITALITYLHNLISSQYPTQTEPTNRMILAILTEQGYSKGFEIIEELFSEEKDKDVKEKLSSEIVIHHTFLKVQNELMNVIQDSESSLLNWINSNNLDSNQTYKILFHLSYYLDYFDTVKDKEKLENILDNVLDDYLS